MEALYRDLLRRGETAPEAGDTETALTISLNACRLVTETLPFDYRQFGSLPGRMWGQRRPQTGGPGAGPTQTSSAGPATHNRRGGIGTFRLGQICRTRVTAAASALTPALTPAPWRALTLRGAICIGKMWPKCEPVGEVRKVLGRVSKGGATPFGGLRPRPVAMRRWPVRWGRSPLARPHSPCSNQIAYATRRVLPANRG